MIHSLVYKDIAKKLLAENLGIKWIDIWNNQSGEDSEFTFSRTAVFFEFGSAPVRLIPGRVYEFIYDINLHVVSDFNSDTHFTENSDEATVDTALEHFNIIDHIIKSLTGYGNNAIGMDAWQLVGMDIAESSTALIEHVMIWRVRMTTKIAQRELVIKRPDVKLETKIKTT